MSVFLAPTSTAQDRGMATEGAPPSGEERAADGQKLSNKIRWSTASEIDNLGYEVYRGENEDGPFARVTTETIPGAGTTDVPSYYEFIDDTIEPDRAYYYYVESIGMNGDRARFTPVIRAKPKTPRERSDPREKQQSP